MPSYQWARSDSDPRGQRRSRRWSARRACPWPRCGRRRGTWGRPRGASCRAGCGTRTPEQAHTQHSVSAPLATSTKGAGLLGGMDTPCSACQSGRQSTMPKGKKILARNNSDMTKTLCVALPPMHQDSLCTTDTGPQGQAGLTKLEAARWWPASRSAGEYSEK